MNLRRPGDGPGRTRCPEVQRWLQAFLDDEMQDEAMVMRLAAHLDVCLRCRAEARTLSELKDCLRRLLPRVDPAAVRRLHDFAQNLEHRIGSRPPP